MPEQEMQGGPIGFDGDEDIDDGDFDIGTADLGISDGDDLMDDVDLGFDGTEDADAGAEPTASDGDADTEGPDLEDAINSGLARTAVYGLPEHDKEDLQEEFHEIAEAFHVGYFGDQVAQEYLARDLEDIPPEIGLAAASLAFAAVVIHKRPDGELIVRRARWRFHEAKQKYTGEQAESAADSSGESDETTDDADAEE